MICVMWLKTRPWNGKRKGDKFCNKFDIKSILELAHVLNLFFDTKYSLLPYICQNVTIEMNLYFKMFYIAMHSSGYMLLEWQYLKRIGIQYKDSLVLTYPVCVHSAKPLFNAFINLLKEIGCGFVCNLWVKFPRKLLLVAFFWHQFQHCKIFNTYLACRSLLFAP